MSAQKSCNSQGGHGFSGSGFPHETDDIPFLHMKVKMINYCFRDQMVMELQIQIYDIKHNVTSLSQGAAPCSLIPFQPLREQAEAKHHQDNEYTGKQCKTGG